MSIAVGYVAALWLLRSGAFVIWGEHATHKDAVPLSWLVSLLLALPLGLLIAGVFWLQIWHVAAWWRRTR
ncbi:MAG: hypothetical protein AAGA11_18370 [Pseudomonadota bacterium]